MDEKKENTILEYWTRRVARDPIGTAREAAELEINIRRAEEIRAARMKAEAAMLEDLQAKIDQYHKAFNFVIDKTLEGIGDAEEKKQ